MSQSTRRNSEIQNFEEIQTEFECHQVTIQQILTSNKLSFKQKESVEAYLGWMEVVKKDCNLHKFN